MYIRKSYSGSITRKLLPEAVDFAGTKGDNLSSRIIFSIPTQYADYKAYIKFDILLESEYGPYSPSYELENNVFTIPIEISSYDKEVIPYRLEFRKEVGNEKEDIVEFSITNYLKFASTSDMEKRDYLTQDWFAKISKIVYKDSRFTLNENTDRPNIIFTSLDGEEHVLPLEMPFLEEGKVPRRLLDDDYIIDLFFIQDDEELITLEDANIGDFVVNEANGNVFICIKSEVLGDWYRIHSPNPTFDSIKVTGGAEFESDIDIEGDVRIGGDLLVEGSIDAVIDIIAQNNIEATGDLIAGSDLDIGGDGHIIGSLEVGGETRLRSGLDVDGDVQIGTELEKSDLSVNGGVAIGDDVSVEGEIYTSLDEDRVIVSDTEGKLDVSDVSKSEVNSLTGIQGNVQTQLDTKEEWDNKTDEWGEIPNDVNYPTEKLVRDTFDAIDERIDDVDERDEGQDTRMDTMDTRMDGIDTRDTTQETRMTAIEGVDEAQDTRMTAIEGVDTAQNTRMDTMDTRMDGIDTRDEGQDTRMTAIEGVDTAQNTRMDNMDTRMDGIDTRDEGQDARLDAIELKNTAQDTRMGGIDARIDGVDARDTAQESRMTTIEAKDTAQDGRLTAIEAKNNTQDGRLDDIEGKDEEQDGRLTDIEEYDEGQDGRMDAIDLRDDGQDARISLIEAVDSGQDTRMDGIDERIDGVDAKDTAQDTRMTTIEAKDSVQDGRLTAVESKNDAQDGRLDDIEAKDSVQDGRLTAIEGINTAQSSRMDDIEAVDVAQNTRMTTIEAKDTAQDGRLDGIDTRIDDVDLRDDGQDARMAVIEGKDSTQDARMTAIEGVNTTQDGRLDAIESVDSGQDTRMDEIDSRIDGIDEDIGGIQGDIISINTDLDNKLNIEDDTATNLTIKDRLTLEDADVISYSNFGISAPIISLSGDAVYINGNVAYDTHLEIETRASPGDDDAVNYKQLTDGLSDKVDKNDEITAGTKCKITYDAKGLVTAGADLSASDIPQLSTDKITGLDTAITGINTTIGTIQGDITGLSTNKADDNAVVHLSGAESVGGIKTFTDGIKVGTTLSPKEAVINGTLNVEGDIVQQGESYVTHAEEIETESDFITMRKGAVAGLTTGKTSGFKFEKYDGVNDGELGIDSTGTVMVGKTGDLQPLLTRKAKEDMQDDKPIVWNATDKRGETRALIEGDIPALSISKTTGLQTALDGKLPLSGGTMTGNIFNQTEFTDSAKFGYSADYGLGIQDAQVFLKAGTGFLRFYSTYGTIPVRSTPGDNDIVAFKQLTDGLSPKANKSLIGTITGGTSTTSFSFTHSLTTIPMVVTMYDTTSGKQVEADISSTSSNVTVKVNNPVPSGTKYNIYVLG